MEKGKCKIKMIMEFERIKEDGNFIYSPEGKQEGKKGDYIIKNPHGFSFIVDKDYFEENYEIIEEKKEKEITMPEILAKNILIDTFGNLLEYLIKPTPEIDEFFNIITTKEVKPKMIEFKERKNNSSLEGELKMEERGIKSTLPEGNHLFMSVDDYKRLTNLTPYKVEDNKETEDIIKMTKYLYNESLDKSLVEKKKLLARVNDILIKNTRSTPSNMEYYLKVNKELSEEIKDIENKLKEIDNEKM